MSAVCFTIPLKPGRSDAFRELAREVLSNRQAEYGEMLARYGLRDANVWIQRFGGTEYALVVHEVDDNYAELLADWPSSKEPFDLWYDKQLLNCYDVKSLSEMPPQPEFLYEYSAAVEG